MVGVTKLFKPRDDKEKLTTVDIDTEKGGVYVDDLNAYTRPEIIVTRQAIRTRLCVRVLCLLTCFLFGCFLIVGGVLLYRFFNTPKTWYNICSVKYKTPETGFLIDRGGLYADDLIDEPNSNVISPIFKPKELENDENGMNRNGGDDDDDDDVDDSVAINNNSAAGGTGDSGNDDDDDESIKAENGEFKQEVSLNLTRDVEQITVPSFYDYRKASFIHDFSQNWSVIFDVDTNRCFIMPLDRNKIAAPKNFFDLIIKAYSGYYLPENILLHENYKVQTPELSDLTQFGTIIQQKCKSATSYLLKKQHLLGQNHSISKRNSVEKRCEFPFKFINSVGKVTLAYHLTC